MTQDNEDIRPWIQVGEAVQAITASGYGQWSKDQQEKRKAWRQALYAARARKARELFSSLGWKDVKVTYGKHRWQEFNPTRYESRVLFKCEHPPRLGMQSGVSFSLKGWRSEVAWLSIKWRGWVLRRVLDDFIFLLFRVATFGRYDRYQNWVVVRDEGSVRTITRTYAITNKIMKFVYWRPMLWMHPRFAGRIKFAERS